MQIFIEFFFLPGVSNKNIWNVHNKIRTVSRQGQVSSPTKDDAIGSKRRDVIGSARPHSLTISQSQARTSLHQS